MFENIRKDYSRFKGSGLNIIGMVLRFLGNAGFRAIVFYRCGHWCRKHRLGIVAIAFERLMHHLCHCWISTSAQIGPGFLIAHVCGLVIGGKTRIGCNCDVRQNVTFGGNFNKKDSSGRTQPWVGDNVSVGAGAVIVGPVKIGSNSIIGANSVVARDIPEGVIVSGIPAVIIKKRWHGDSGRQL